MKPKDLKPGTRIQITINGEKVETEIDRYGVQRLMPCLPHLRDLVDSGAISLQRMMADVGRGIAPSAARWLYQHIGTSVSCYQDVFPEDEIVNPLWK